jgi:hypothetical protein
MNTKQISVFLENKVGRVAEVMQIIAKENINVKALSLSDTTDFGVLRLIVDDPEKCKIVLKNNGLVAQETEVIGIEIEDRPGGLFKVLDILQKNNINIEYMYATVERNRDNAVVIFKVDYKDKAIISLEKNGIVVAGKDDVLKNLSK